MLALVGREVLYLHLAPPHPSWVWRLCRLWRSVHVTVAPPLLHHYHRVLGVPGRRLASPHHLVPAAG